MDDAQRLVEVALTDYHVSDHSLSSEFMLQFALLNQQNKLAEQSRNVVRSSATMDAKLEETGKALRSHGMALPLRKEFCSRRSHIRHSFSQDAQPRPNELAIRSG